MAVVKRLEGQRFGRLVAVKEVGRTNNGNAKWLCKCDCGGQKVVASYALRIGRTQSCGCIKAEQNYAKGTHHETGSPIYKLWSCVKNRCYNQNDPKYPQYGGRGITVCDEWKTNYESFRDWCQDNGYKKGLTIDRVNVNGNYCPQNCRFSTQKVQQNNRTNNHLLSFRGETHTMAEWSDILGIPYRRLEHRINRGWSAERALTSPKEGE